MKKWIIIMILCLAKGSSVSASTTESATVAEQQKTIIALATVVAILALIIMCGIAWLIFKLQCIHCLRSADIEQINDNDGTRSRRRQRSQDSAATDYEQMSSIFSRGFKFSFSRSSQKRSQGIPDFAENGTNAFRVNGGPSPPNVASFPFAPPPLVGKSPTFSGKHSVNQLRPGDKQYPLKLGGSLLSVNQMIQASQDSEMRKLMAPARVADDDDEDPYDTLPIRDAPIPVCPIPAEDNSAVKYIINDSTCLTNSHTGDNDDSALDKKNNAGESPMDECRPGNANSLRKDIKKGDTEKVSHSPIAPKTEQATIGGTESDLKMRSKNTDNSDGQSRSRYASDPRNGSAEESEVDSQGRQRKNKKDKERGTDAKTVTSSSTSKLSGATASVTQQDIQKDHGPREAKEVHDHSKVTCVPGNSEFQAISLNAMAQQLNLKLQNDAKAFAQEKREIFKKNAVCDAMVGDPNAVALRKQVTPQKHIAVTRESDSQNPENDGQNESRDSRLNPTRRQHRKSMPDSRILGKGGKLYVENEALAAAMTKMKSKQQTSANSSSGEEPSGKTSERATSGIAPSKKDSESDNKSSSEEEEVEEEEMMEEDEGEEEEEEEAEEEEEEEDDEENEESSSSD